MPIAFQDGKVVTQDGKVSCQCCDGVCPASVCQEFSNSGVAEIATISLPSDFFDGYFSGGAWSVSVSLSGSFVLNLNDVWIQPFQITSNGTQTLTAAGDSGGNSCCNVYRAFLPVTITSSNGIYQPPGQVPQSINNTSGTITMQCNIIAQINQRATSTRLRIAAQNVIQSGITLNGTSATGQSVSETATILYSKQHRSNFVFAPIPLQPGANQAAPTQGTIFGSNVLPLIEFLSELTFLGPTTFTDINISNSFNWEFVPAPP